MKEKYQVLHLTPATSPPDTLRPGRPKDPIPRRVCLAASAPFDRREARIRENNGKKSELNLGRVLGQQKGVEGDHNKFPTGPSGEGRGDKNPPILFQNQ